MWCLTTQVYWLSGLVATPLPRQGSELWRARSRRYMRTAELVNATCAI